MHQFEELDVWKRSASPSIATYKNLEQLEDFGYKNQITRTGLSISSNIAEGYERESKKEMANFQNYAKGYAGELRPQFYIGMKTGFIDREIGRQWANEAEEISRMLHKLIQTFKSAA